MSFIHTRCGGILLPIAVHAIPWNQWPGGAWQESRALTVRCADCRLEGEILQVEEYKLERRRLWRGLEPR